MIRSRLGRRVGAVLAALLLLLNLAAPLAGASASSSNLPPVGWAETVSSFLMACGIYPFETDEDGNYTEWSAASLVPLWNQFREDVTSINNDIWDMVGYLVNGVIAIASGRWSVLREFASWIVSKFNVTDNQIGIQLGESYSNYVPVFASKPSFTDIVSDGLTLMAGNGQSRYVGVSASGVLPYYSRNAVVNGHYWWVYFVSFSPFTMYYTDFGVSSVYSNDGLSSVVYNGKRIYYNSLTAQGQGGYTNDIPDLSGGPQQYPKEVYDYLIGGGEIDFSGVTADTTTVSVPAELPADTQYGGLTVAGAGAAVTVEALTEIVQEAVIEGLKPVVNTVNVNLSPDIEVNPDTGEITQGEITVTPADIDLVASDYQIRQLHTVFPFSIPWDVYNIFAALNAEPVRPYWDVSLTLPGILGQPDTQIPFTIGISDDSPLARPVDNFAALARNFFLVLMCVGTLMLFRKR